MHAHAADAPTESQLVVMVQSPGAKRSGRAQQARAIVSLSHVRPWVAVRARGILPCSLNGSPAAMSPGELVIGAPSLSTSLALARLAKPPYSWISDSLSTVLMPPRAHWQFWPS